jgi:O-antigen/teichoic acid export membrane protein
LLLAIAISADPLIRTFLGQDYLGSVGPLRVYCVAVGLIFVTQPMISFLQAVGRPNDVLVVVGPAAISFIALVGLLGFVAGAMGGAWAFVIVNAAITICILLQFRRNFFRKAKGQDTGLPEE